MKKSYALIAAMLMSIALSMGSCTFTKSKEPASQQTGPEYTSSYVCPMHCEGSGSDTPGTCPVCKMDYVLNDTQQ